MIEDLMRADNFRAYLGKAILALAVLGPLTYCTAQDKYAGAEVKAARIKALADLQTICIEKRGNWDSRKEECSFDD